MPLNHDEAAASITVTGVSLGCVNPETKTWEVGFIRHPTHSLMMQVTKHSNGAEEVVHPNAAIPPGCAITVSATNPANAETTLFREPGDPEDFDLIVDIENDLYDGIRIPRKQPEHEVTPLIVPGAVLYSVADMLSEFPVRVIRKGDKNFDPVKTLDEIGTAAGADILSGEGGEVVVAVDGPGGFELRLPHEAGTRYTVAFDNTCPADPDRQSEPVWRGEEAALYAEASEAGPKGARKPPVEPAETHSDFVLYYAVLDPPADREHFDLVADDADNRGDGAVCNYSHLGVTTSLFPVV